MKSIESVTTHKAKNEEKENMHKPQKSRFAMEIKMSRIDYLPV